MHTSSFGKGPSVEPLCGGLEQIPPVMIKLSTPYMRCQVKHSWKMTRHVGFGLESSFFCFERLEGFLCRFLLEEAEGSG